MQREEVLKTVPVDRIVEKVQYYPAPETHNLIETRYEPVERIVNVPVPVIEYREIIKEVPQIVEKIVEIRDII